MPIAVNLWSLNSNIALACSSVKEQFPFLVIPCLGSSINLIKDSTSLAFHSLSIRSSFASAGDFDDLINLIISSILETAIANPTKI